MSNSPLPLEPVASDRAFAGCWPKSPFFRPTATQCIVLNNTDSSNSAALAHSATVHTPTWFLALSQSAGRGRARRQWSTPPGNFAASLLCRLPDAYKHRPQLYGFVAGLAVWHSCQHYITQYGSPRHACSLGLKWPNDIVLNGCKLAGILIERVDTCIAVGIGVNLIALPERTALRSGGLPPITLGSVLDHPTAPDNNIDLSPQGFLTILAGFYDTFAQYFMRYGFAFICSEWLKRAAGLNAFVTLTDQCTGIFTTLDQTSGAMILNDNGTDRIIQTGDVSYSLFHR